MGRKEITIEKGIISVDGVEVGTANHALRFGYCPMILVTIGDRKDWFELTTANLVDTIKENVEKIFTK